MSKKVTLKDHETVVTKDDFGFLVREFVHTATKPNNRFNEEWLDKAIRDWWPLLDEYNLRHIQCDIEVAIALDEPPRYNREPLVHKEMWKKIIADLRPPKSPYTIKYRCDRCKTADVKLWRGVHGCPDDDGSKLLCATCLAPDVKVDDEGRWQEPPYKSKDAYGNEIPGMRTDQVKGWLPAIPVGDTYWGYSSVPSQDVEWWKKLPTYKK